MLANKLDAPSAKDNLAILRELHDPNYEILAVSAQTGEGLGSLPRTIFERLDLVRVHTKVPGKKADLDTPPYVLKAGSTVLDLARLVHRDFEHSLKYARIWSTGLSRHPGMYDGQMVERTHKLEDGVILELHV
jgi:ribosome-interacting GTPase 1